MQHFSKTALKGQKVFRTVVVGCIQSTLLIDSWLSEEAVDPQLLSLCYNSHYLKFQAVIVLLSGCSG